MQFHYALGIIFFSLFFLIMGVQAQQVLATSGLTVTDTRGSVSFTIGQPFYTSYTNFDGSITQGVQQSILVDVATSTDIAEGVSCTAYPNPVSQYLIITVNDVDRLEPEALFFDSDGKFIFSKKLNLRQTSIPANLLVTGTVFNLAIRSNGKLIKTFRIIKK